MINRIFGGGTIFGGRDVRGARATAESGSTSPAESVSISQAAQSGGRFHLGGGVRALLVAGAVVAGLGMAAGPASACGWNYGPCTYVGPSVSGPGYMQVVPNGMGGGVARQTFINPQGGVTQRVDRQGMLGSESHSVATLPNGAVVRQDCSQVLGIGGCTVTPVAPPVYYQRW